MSVLPPFMINNNVSITSIQWVTLAKYANNTHIVILPSPSFEYLTHILSITWHPHKTKQKAQARPKMPASIPPPVANRIGR